mmetsp:Transcript_35741/g.57409  ORF Transcript_35741/g.57409 Transcript_35741/m.57409 type:complete len:239 (-) Transcript_35741:1095-1811(-)
MLQHVVRQYVIILLFLAAILLCSSFPLLAARCPLLLAFFFAVDVVVLVSAAAIHSNQPSQDDRHIDQRNSLFRLVVHLLISDVLHEDGGKLCQVLGTEEAVFFLHPPFHSPGHALQPVTDSKQRSNTGIAVFYHNGNMAPSCMCEDASDVVGKRTHRASDEQVPSLKASFHQHFVESSLVSAVVKRLCVLPPYLADASQDPQKSEDKQTDAWGQLLCAPFPGGYERALYYQLAEYDRD